MIKNWLRTAFRNIRKNPSSSLINIFGLTVGLSSCLLIALFIRHELSYDDFEVNGPRIARVIMGYKFDGGGEMRWGNFTSTKVAPASRILLRSTVDWATVRPRLRVTTTTPTSLKVRFSSATSSAF